MVFLLYNSFTHIFPPPPRQYRMVTCAFYCHGNCRKKQLHRGAPGKKHISHRQLLHITIIIVFKAFWYFCLRCLSAYNFIMCKGIKPSSHCLHLPFLPTPHTFHAVASSLLLVPRNFTTFTAPTAANKPRSSSYQLLKPTALSGWTRIQAGE